MPRTYYSSKRTPVSYNTKYKRYKNYTNTRQYYKNGFSTDPQWKKTRMNNILYPDRIPKGMPLVVGNSQMVHLRFVETTSMVVGATGFSTGATTYALNNPYAPNQTAVTPNQTPGFNEWGAFYNKYKVMSTKFCAEIVNSQTEPIYGGIFYNPAGNTITSWQNFMEMRGNRDSLQYMINAISSDKNQRRMCLTRSLGDLYGLPGEYQDDGVWAGATSGSPPSLIFGGVYVASYNGTVNVGLNPVKVEIDFWVKFFDPRPNFN